MSRPRFYLSARVRQPVAPRLATLVLLALGACAEGATAPSGTAMAPTDSATAPGEGAESPAQLLVAQADAAQTPEGVQPQAADRNARATIAIGDAKNQVIVHFRDRAAFRRDSAHQAVGQVIDQNPVLNSRLLRVPDVAGAIKGLSHNPNVLFVEQNTRGELAFDPNDPKYSSEWHLGSWESTRGTNVRAAWDLTAGYRGGKIIIVDTGLDYTHPDLAGKNPAGYNFAENSTNWYDCNGHGTEVAGAAAASTNNGRDVAGVDMWAEIYVAKVYPACTKGQETDVWIVAKGISQSSAWAGAKVMNISSRFVTYSKELDSAVQLARSRNIVVVAAAGNDNSNTAVYPAALSGVLAVAATDRNGRRAVFSNWGSNWGSYNVDVAAPGVGICTTQTAWLGGGSTCVDGTSLASPLVAGIAMLVRSRHPSESESSIRSRIIAASYNPELRCWKCYSNNYGYGVVNAYYAVR